jgi:tetratricopeptide (TPR) repeat protein
MREVGDNELATSLYSESYELRKEIGDSSRIALSLVNLGEMALLAGERERGESLFEEAVSIARQIGDRRHECFALYGLGWLTLSETRYEECGRWFMQSLSIARDLSHGVVAIEILSGLAALAAALGDDGRAARLAGAVDALGRTIGRHITPLNAGVDRPFLDAARARFNDWEEAWTQGSSMSLDEALGFALKSQ